MKNFNFFEKLWEHSRTLRRVGLVLVMCLITIPQAWAYSIWGAKTIYVDNLIAEWEQPEMQVYKNESTKPSYRFTQIGSTSFWYYYFSSDWDGYDHIYYYNYVNDAWGNKSAQQKYDVHPSSFAVVVPKSGYEGCAIGYFTDTKKATPDHRIYFDATPIDGWGSKAYLRYGFDCVAHADPMTKFPGTANLWYIDVQEAYYEKYTVANAAGYTKANTVYQPTSSCKPTGEYEITKSLNFSDTDIDGGSSKILRFVPTTKASTSDGCDWYNYTKTSNSSMPTQSVTIKNTTNGKIRVDYTNTSGTETYIEVTTTQQVITVPQSAIITVTAIGNTGYNVNTLSVGGAAFTSGNTYTVTAATTISATFVAKIYSISLDKQQGSSGSTSVTMTYNSSSHTSITAPTAPTGYTFAGWYTGALGTGSMVMNASGVLQTNVTNFTGAGGIWTKDGTCTLYAKYTASYPDGYLYITDVKSNPETKAGYTITSSVSSAAFNGSMGDSFASNHSGYQYWSRTTGSGSTTLSFSGNLAASATAGGLTIDVWWGAEDNRSTTIKLNGGDAVALDAVPESKDRNAVRKATYNTEMKSLSSIQLLCGSAKAVWFRIGVKERPGYLLTYDDGDGSGAPSAEYKPNATITLSSTIPTYAGHMFAGWQVNGAGAIYAPGATFDMPAEATTLVAKWEENCYQGTITKSSGSLTASHGGETSLTASDATITSGGGIKIVNTNTGSGSVNYDCTSDGMNINTTNGYIEFKLPSGSVLATGSIIRVQGKASNSSYGLKIIDDSGNEIAKQTNKGAIDFTYTVTAQSAINGNDHVRINRVTGNGTIIKAVTVAGCGSVSCYTPAEPTISGTADYIVGQTLTLTADISGSNHDASTTYTWYKGANWATASESSPVQAAAVAGSNGHIFTKTAAVGDAGTYWCKASNGTGCESHNSTGKAITVAYQVTYAANGGTGDAMANSTGTSITLSANSYTAPSGYTFDGWRTVLDKQASGTDYAAGTSSITANLDLYAMWKQTVTLDDNGGTKDGSAVVYYNASSASTPSAPTYSGYTADGYYAEPGCTNLVMSTAGALTNYSGYVSGGKWVHSGATTLYAHYKCTAPTISCTDNVVTMSTTSTGATIYYTYTTDGSTPSDPTSSSTAYDPSNKPVIAANTTIKAIAIQAGCTSSSVTTQSCTYTAFSTSINIEQFVLDNDANKNLSGQFTALKSALDAAHISYDLSSGCSIDTLNDEPNNQGVYKVQRNYPYLGLKIKSTGKYVQINLPKDKTLKVKFGNIAANLNVWIDEVVQDAFSKDDADKTYELASSGSNRVVKLATSTGDAVVIKQIMIGEAIQSVTLPGKITTTSGGNGTITAPVNGAKVDVGSTVTITTSPSSGYELESLTVTRDTTDNPTVTVTSNQFTMPNGNVTINATFVLSGHSVTAVTCTGDDTYGTVSAAASTVAEGGTTVITAVPATGYKVTNWAVSGEGSSISPSGESNSNTTTLTMGSADATVTVTFGPKTYALTLDKNGGTANGSASITWNQRLVTFDPHATAPNASFSLDGYYTAAEGGTKIISGSGSEYIVSAYIPGWTSDADLPSWAHDADATLYAYWRRYINLNSNWDYHGTNLNYGSVSVILGGAPSGYEAATGEEGYTLQGYYTEKLGGTKVFNANGTYAADDVDGFIEDGKWIYTTEGTLSLYAHWAKQYTVTYDGNEATSGSAPSATSAFFGDDVTVAGNTGTLVKTGYTFVGWNTAADGTGSFYAVGSEFTITGDITLYAQWADCSGGGSTTVFSLTSITGVGSGLTTTAKDVGAYYDASSYCTLNSLSDGVYIGGCSNSGSFSNRNLSYESSYNAWSFGQNTIYLALYSATGFKAGDVVTMVEGTSNTQSPAFAKASASSLEDLKNTDYNYYDTYHLTMSSETAPASGNSYTYTGTLPEGFVSSNWLIVYRPGQTFKMQSITVTRSGGGSGCSTYNVSFANMTGFAGETTLPSTITGVYGGSTIAEPVTPKASGYAFAGWYKEGACTNKWDFSTDVVSSAKTLYAKWIDIDDTYTFHMGDGDIDNDSWKVATFTPTGVSNYQAITNFEIPNQTRYPSFFVGYEGEFVEYAPSSGYSKMREWDGYYNMTTYQSGYIKIQGNASPISDGNTKTAAGAKGTLQMSSSTHSENWGLVFIPDGFGLTISYEEDETPKTLIVPLRQTDNEKVWETESFTTAKGNALTAAQIAGTFKVGLATATPNVYVDCYQTTEEAASAINARKLVAAYGGADMAAGASGRFQIIMSSNTSLPNFGLRWVPLENHTKQSGSWDGMGVSYTLSDKWSLEHAPTIEEDVYIEHYTGITNDAQANSVYINKSTAYMNLTISSIGSLLVMNDIKAKMADDDAYRATTENDINIETDYIYNGSLITAKKSTDTKASYRFCTKAYKVDGYGYINQFIGIPFTEMDAFQLYGSLLYQYDKDANKWVTCSQNMEAYHAYNILRRSTEGRAVFDLDGTLILPGIEAGNKEKVLECNSGRSAEASSWRGEHLFANSWTAPIEIGAMTEGDFHDVDPTIYIFNAGSVNTATDEQKEEYDLGDNPGQWTALPVNDVRTHPENYSYKVIPAMQAFSIRATAANGTLTLDYKKHVYDPIMANSGVVDHTALRAPKQTVEPSVRLRMVVTGENHYKDETQIHERADFSNGHDAGWDGYKIFGNAHSPQLYTVSDNKQLSVNAIPDMEGTVVGFEKGSDDNVYTFSFKYDGEDIWYLNDLKEQTSTLINNENTYIFSAESGDAATRFIISATPIMKVTTGVENVQGDDVQGTKVHKVLINDHIYIIRGGRMYDATGKMLK